MEKGRAVYYLPAGALGISSSAVAPRQRWVDEALFYRMHTVLITGRADSLLHHPNDDGRSNQFFLSRMKATCLKLLFHSYKVTIR